MRSVLVTGARAPVALELARRLHKAGVSVTAGDSLRFPMTRFSCAAPRYLQISSPRFHTSSFREEIENWVGDLVLPTCEEVFWLENSRVFAPSPSLLHELHSKWRFVQLCHQLGLAVPETRLVRRLAELEGMETGELVLKPEYSRFGTQTLLRPLQLPPGFPAGRSWVAQQFLTGEEVSTYGIAHQGRLMAHVCYRPLARAGGGAGTAFQSVQSDPVLNWVQRFVGETGYHGQVGFDFILDPRGEPTALECNPRATSGVHLFARDFDLVAALEGRGSLQLVRAGQWAMLTLPSVLVEPRLLMGQRPRPILFSSEDPWPGLTSWLGVLEFAAAAVRGRQSLAEAMTEDIRWDGPV